MSKEKEFIKNFLSSRNKEHLYHIVNKYKRHINWDILFYLLKFHGIAPYFYYIFNKNNLLKFLKKDFVSILREYYYYVSLHNMHIKRELLRLNTIFRELSLPILTIKGGALFTKYYEHIGLRPMQDIDFLVSKTHINIVKQVLISSGYVLNTSLPEDVIENFHFHYTFIRPGTDILVEVHWRLSDEYLTDVKMVNDILEKREFFPTINGFVPNIKDHVAYLCLHLYKHGFLNYILALSPKYNDLILDPTTENRIIWFLDLWKILSFHKTMDIYQVEEIAREWNTDEAFTSSMVLLRNLYGRLPIPSYTPKIDHNMISPIKHIVLSILAEGIAKNYSYIVKLIDILNRFDPRMHLRPIRALNYIDLFLPSYQNLKRKGNSLYGVFLPLMFIVYFFVGFFKVSIHLFSIIKIKYGKQ